MIRMTLRWASVLAAVLAATLTIAVTPAWADFRIYLKGQGYGTIYSAQHWADVCDTNANGIGMRIYVIDNYGGLYTAVDPNGSASGCGGIHTSQTTQRWNYIRVCTNVSSPTCTLWHQY